MGMYDEVRIDRDEPQLCISRGDCFQTKSLFAGFARFTITADGKLIEHCYRYESAKGSQELSEPIVGHRVELGDKAIEYHGDILLTRYQSGMIPDSIVARFTHGQLEAIWPVEEYPATNRELLMEQGAR